MSQVSTVWEGPAPGNEEIDDLVSTPLGALLPKVGHHPGWQLPKLRILNHHPLIYPRD